MRIEACACRWTPIRRCIPPSDSVDCEIKWILWIKNDVKTCLKQYMVEKSSFATEESESIILPLYRDDPSNYGC